MLLNRRRINKWARWVALGLAIVFAVSFAFLGVGSGVPGMDFTQLWTSNGSSSSRAAGPEAKSPEELIEEFEARVAQDPEDADALVGLGTQYLVLDQPDLAAQYFEKALEVRPEDAGVLRQLAAIYTSPDSRNDEAAVRVLNKLTELEPGNADAFLQLGAAQRNLGNDKAAVLAWNRFLELAPESQMAETVQAEIERLSASGGEGS
ncbi:MAG: hypothetical protein Kow00129_00940 [Thermoleophilia bacterium]